MQTRIMLIKYKNLGHILNFPGKPGTISYFYRKDNALTAVADIL